MTGDDFGLICIGFSLFTIAYVGYQYLKLRKTEKDSKRT